MEIAEYFVNQNKMFDLLLLNNFMHSVSIQLPITNCNFLFSANIGGLAGWLRLFYEMSDITR